MIRGEQKIDSNNEFPPSENLREPNFVVLDVFLAIFQDLYPLWLHYGRGELKTDRENEFLVSKNPPGGEVRCSRCILSNFSTSLPPMASL